MAHMTIAKRKDILRKEVQTRTEALGAEQRKQESQKICDTLLQKISEGSKVCAYFPMKSEVNIEPLLQVLLDRGDTIYLPRWNDENAHITFHKLNDIADVQTNAFGIPEPQEGVEELGKQEVDVILVPGRAFDQQGNRLGRGRGGYDRWLQSYTERHTDTHLWGIAFRCQIVKEIPTEIHDIPMNAVIMAK